MLKSLKRAVKFNRTVKLSRPLGPSDGPGGRAVLLGGQEIDELEAVLPYTSATPMRARLEQGDLCYAARNEEGEVESFVWIASGRNVYFYEFDADIAVPDRVAYFYDAYTVPGARGRGLMVELLEGSLAALRDASFAVDHCEAWTSARNRAAVRAFEKAGFEVYGSYRWLALGPARLHRSDLKIGDNGR